MPRPPYSQRRRGTPSRPRRGGHHSRQPGRSPRNRSVRPRLLITALDKEPAKNWYCTEEQLEHTPSRQQGVSAEAELILREKGTRMVLKLADNLTRSPRLSHVSCLYFHRFYMRKSFIEYSEYKLVAATCLWISAKLDDRPIKSAHMVEAFIKVLNKDPSMKVDFNSPLFEEYRRRLLFYEIEAFRTLNFDALPKTPHETFIEIYDNLKVSGPVVDAATGVFSDCYFSTICLMFPARFLAAAAIFFGAKMIGAKVPVGVDGRSFRKVTDVEDEERYRTFKAAVNEMNEYYVRHPCRQRHGLGSNSPVKKEEDKSSSVEASAKLGEGDAWVMMERGDPTVRGEAGDLSGRDEMSPSIMSEGYASSPTSILGCKRKPEESVGTISPRTDPAADHRREKRARFADVSEMNT
ncbi:cyclin-like protein [Fimicolochytrium jonesii]|uniref:cyclin-like protein n=1 Tax=Fimicolochytrium jonesii TaxID=1396493 RepID=UPI0022FE4CF3|nr:cyclin-like protein [Fimicolochytrium jonesii]KAI8817970.1 cyclin-like protein [Fimicolochytrium jonesii]